jgi:hypothetical protein
MLSRVMLFIFSFKAIEVAKSRFSKFQHTAERWNFVDLHLATRDRFKTKNRQHQSTQRGRLPLP